MESTYFRPIQKKNEILQLLDRIQGINPRRLCEIGAAGGGTLSLLTHVANPNAELFSIDIGYSPEWMAAIESFAREDQTVNCCALDSHDPQTVETLRQMLQGTQLDVLFIDGDHSLDGVRQDFLTFAPLVRKDGIIAFHDIVSDYSTRFGIETGQYTGDVPQFWARLRTFYPSTEELIEDVGQDGYGIGVMEWPGKFHDTNVLRTPTTGLFPEGITHWGSVAVTRGPIKGRFDSSHNDHAQ